MYLKISSSEIDTRRRDSISTEASHELEEKYTGAYQNIVDIKYMSDAIDVGDVSRVCMFQSTNTAFISDWSNRRIFSLSLDDLTIKYFDFGGGFQEPWSLAFDNKNMELFVGDFKQRRVFVFDQHVRKVNNINLRAKKVNMCALEVDSDNHLLYISDSYGNNITIWNTLTKRFLKKRTVRHPTQMKVKDQQIYIVSGTDDNKFVIEKMHKNNTKQCKLVSMGRGENCIFVYDRFNWTQQKKICLENWFNPRGLHIDENMNILTVAHSLSIRNIVSRSEYLFVFNTDGLIRQKTKLNFDNVHDFAVCDKRIVFVRGEALPPRISILQFD
jgi:hypothetical protein